MKRAICTHTCNVKKKIVLLTFVSLFLLSATLGTSFITQAAYEQTINSDPFPQADKFYTLAGRAVYWKITSTVGGTTYPLLGTYTLTITTTVGGTSDPSVGSYTYVEGTVVSVSALSNTGYMLGHWELDGVEVTPHPGDTINVIMDANHTLNAVFAAVPSAEYVLTITSTVGGKTDLPPGSYTYAEGTVITAACPDAGYVFDYWELDGAIRTENPISVTMDMDHTLHAVFTTAPPPPPPPTPPVASFTYSPSQPMPTETITFDSSSSTADGGTIVSYEWDFDDGNTTTATDAVITHVYTAAENYNVTLTVIDDEGLTDTCSQLITVRGYPVASFTYSPDRPLVNEAVTFDGSTSYDPDGDILGYEWDFGDGAVTVENDLIVEHAYASDGTYPVKLTVTEKDELSGTTVKFITVEIDITKPVADAGPNQTVNEDSPIILDGSASSDNVGITVYTWTFTDVTAKTLLGEKQTYTFNTPGVYAITLNVTDAAGNWATDTVVITVLDATKPVADAGTDQIVVEDIVVSFNAGGSSDNVGIDKYEWEFGDETTGTGMIITYTYTEPGIYTVTLTVKDEAGNSDTDSTIITVERDTDGDNDGVNDDEDAFPLDPTETVDTDGDGIGNNADTDDDNDGIPDVWEISNRLKTLDDQDASLDPDNDGLTNLQEYQGNKNPNVYDAEPIRKPRSLYIVAEVAVVGVAVTAAIAALAKGLGQSFNSAVSKLPIPDEVKDFLKLHGEKIFETVDKVKLEALEKAPFITKGELAALGISALITTIVFGFIETNGLPHFLKLKILADVIPSTLLSVCMVSIAGELSEALCARTCRVYRQFRLWMYGLGIFLISGLLFQFPFSSPGITRYQSGEISSKAKGLIVLSKMLILLTLTIPFACLSMFGLKTAGIHTYIIGDAGLLLTLMTVCYSLVPLKPLSGKAVFDYRKEVSLTALVSTGILFYSYTVKLLPYVTYLAVGVVSVFLAEITLHQLRKAHPK